MSDTIRQRAVNAGGGDGSSSFDYADNRNVVLPAAPYPPMNNYDNNSSSSSTRSAPSKSSLSASPHYSTTYGRASTSTSLGGDHTFSATTTAPESGLLGDAMGPTMGTGADNAFSGNSSGAKHYNKSSSNNSGGTSTNSGDNVNSSTSGGPSHPSQLLFCPGKDDILASINCRSSTTSRPKKTRSERQIVYRDGNTLSSNSFGGKSNSANASGPVMLELKRLEEAMKDANDDDEESKANDDGFDSTGSELFTTRTVAVSRGNPNLGITSVTSTCMDVPSMEVVKNYDSGSSSNNAMMAVTGSSTGVLWIHKFSEIESIFDTDAEIPDTAKTSNKSQFFSTSPIDNFQMPRHHRKASSVAWRPAINTNHVAIGLVGSNTTGSGNMNHSNQQPYRRGGSISMRSGGSDREYCCFLWDITDNKKTMPLSKFAYNSPVASLAWMMDGQTLAVGGQQRTIQLYDLRLSTNNNSKLPPLSAHAHESGVHGIEVHPFRSHVMATFCRSVGEPVKLFDIRRMDSVLAEIKLTNSDNRNASGSTASMPTSITAQRMQQAKAEAIQWNTLEPGMLSIATGESVQEYDTNSGSRPTLVRANRTSKPGKVIKAIALYRGTGGPETTAQTGVDGEEERHEGEDLRKSETSPSKNSLLSRLYPQRMLAVLEDQTIEDMAKGTVAPLAISRRDGRLVHTLGPHLFMGSPNKGPAAMEKIIKSGEITKAYEEEEISATMMRRARCLQANPYSMNPELNIKLMSREILREEDLDHKHDDKPTTLSKYSNRALLRLWGWIERVESLSFQEIDDTEDDSRSSKDISNAGVLQLLSCQRNDGTDIAMEEQIIFSETLSCNNYDSIARRAALSACGWAGKFDLSIVMAECEALGEYERSAALAVWHEDVGAAVEALQRASEAVRLQTREGETTSSLQASSQYAETLGLISMCIAGFGGKTESQRNVWRRACASLLQRDDMSSNRAKNSTRISYLRGLCEFLMNAGTIESLLKVLENSNLSLCDRAAFACRFLEKKELTTYLLRCVELCQQQGDLEGLSITGISKPGIKILQSFVDRYTDVQTAALVVSRVILPADWASERKICFEWVESYRSLLNYWQMWQSRAMFDVDRADVLRRFKARNGGGSYQRRMANPRVRQSQRPPDPDILPRIPAQLEARCNYCSSMISLKRQEGTTNQWLSKMQPLLNCCPQCRKPLPRCSVCLLSMNALNPYTELTRARQGPRGGGKNMSSTDNNSSLSSMNFAEWYTWCMRCRHGGHAHHIIGWFSSQKVCPVSGCDCECQFDGAISLNRQSICIEADD